MANNIDVRQMLPQGTLLHEGAYRIDSYLASGGFGNTYIATNMAFGERVAIKEFFLRGQSERTQNMNSIRVTQGQELFFKEQQIKFKKEAQRIRQLRNSHIVRVHDLFDANGTTYYVMDFIEGESVAARIKAKSAPLSEDETIYILSQVLDALNDVHATGLYHLDIKPDNILIDKNGNAFIIDFGASKQQSVNNDGVSRTSAFACTPEYAPLELTTGNVSNIGPWSDIYSVGATAYRMLTNQIPPKSDEIIVDIDAAFRFTENVSPKMRKFIRKCMDINYRQRPQSASDAMALLNSPQIFQPQPKPVDVPKSTAKPEQPKTSASSRPSNATKVLTPEQPKVQSRPSSQPKHKSSKKGLIIGTILTMAIVIIVVVWPSSNKSPKSASNNNGVESYEETEGETIIPEELTNDKESFTVKGVQFTMIRVEGGTYTMGATSEQGSDAWDDEKPAHSVSVGTFYIGETEVTQALWQAVMGSNPSEFKGGQRPVESVSWDDCQTFISKLNSLTGKNFRLPTEEEWEYAARGGNKSRHTKYSGSNDVGSVAWYDVNSGDQTHDVKTKQPNELGIYDMSGNVWECTGSYWRSDYNSSLDMSCRVDRGGGWLSGAMNTRVSCRNYCEPSGDYGLGLRLAVAPQ